MLYSAKGQVQLNITAAERTHAVAAVNSKVYDEVRNIVAVTNLLFILWQIQF